MNEDTKQLASKRDMAALVFEIIPANTTHCLSFFYQMKDVSGMGKLKVIIVEEVANMAYPNWYIAWNREGEQGDRSKNNEWLEAQVNVQSRWPHSLKIQAVRGDGFAVNLTIFLVKKRIIS